MKKEFTFINTLNFNIKVNIKAYNFTEAMDLLLSITRNIDDFRQLSDSGEILT